MTKLYLITGFLGAGKTTFLHQFTRLFPDQRISLVINEFGKAGVDGTLLQDLGIELTEINNGSIFCACKLEQFEDAIRYLQEQRKPDLIFVEASGLADPTAVRGIFRQGMFPGLEYAGAICLVDGVRFHKAYQTAKVCRMQLAISDLVLINKTDLASREQIDTVTEIAKAQKPGRPVHETAYGAFDISWLAEMGQPKADNCSAEGHTRDINLQKLILNISGFDRKSLAAFLKMFAEDTYRIKGFVALEDSVYVVDCVGPMVEVRPFEGDASDLGKLVVLFGHGLPTRRGIKEALSWFPNCTVELER